MLTANTGHAQVDTLVNQDTVYEYNRLIPFYRDTLGNDSVLHEMVWIYDYSDAYQVEMMDSPVYGNPQIREPINNTWRYIVLGVLMLLVALVRMASPGILVRYFQAFFKPKALEDLLDDQDSEIGSFGTLLAFFTSLTYALPLQYLIRLEGYSLSYYAWGEYILLALIVFGAFLFKLAMQAVVGRIMEMKTFVSTLLYSSVTLNFAASLLLIPLFLVLILNHWVVADASILLAVFIGVMFLVAVKLGRTLTFAGNTLIYPPFYLILYLCALEILPWFVIYRVLTIT